MATVKAVLEECEDQVLSRASQRCDKVHLTGDQKGKCTRSQAIALESLKESILNDKDAFEKGPASRNWLKFLVRAQIKGKAVQDSSVVDAIVHDFDRCAVRKYPSGQKFEPYTTINEVSSDYSVAIRTTRAGVSYIEVTKPDQSVEIPVLCKDGSVSFLAEDIPPHIEAEVKRLFAVMKQERKKTVIGNCFRGVPDYGQSSQWISSFGR